MLCVCVWFSWQYSICLRLLLACALAAIAIVAFARREYICHEWLLNSDSYLEWFCAHIGVISFNRIGVVEARSIPRTPIIYPIRRPANISIWGEAEEICFFFFIPFAARGCFSFGMLGTPFIRDATFESAWNVDHARFEKRNAFPARRSM